MAYAIFAEDFALVCFLLADGDPDLGIDEVVSRAEAFQQAHGSHFGVCPQDFRDALAFLGWESGNAARPDCLGVLCFQRLRDWIPLILRRNRVSFNDEGGGWGPSGYDPAGADPRLARIFQDLLGGSPQQNQLRLQALGLDRALLPRYLESSMWGSEAEQESCDSSAVRAAIARMEG